MPEPWGTSRVVVEDDGDRVVVRPLPDDRSPRRADPWPAAAKPRRRCGRANARPERSFREVDRGHVPSALCQVNRRVSRAAPEWDRKEFICADSDYFVLAKGVREIDRNDNFARLLRVRWRGHASPHAVAGASSATYSRPMKRKAPETNAERRSAWLDRSRRAAGEGWRRRPDCHTGPVVTFSV